MSSLTQKKCVPCEIGTPPLTPSQFEPLLKQLKLEWELVEGKKIRHDFKFKDFAAAMEFVNRVAKLAEEEGHHPNIHIYFSKVVIDLTTHNIKGLSENDFILAAKIEEIINLGQYMKSMKKSRVFLLAGIYFQDI